jgi:type IV pilus assembly protein PilM
MDERTNDLPGTGEPEQGETDTAPAGEYGWLSSTTEPAGDEPRTWTDAPAEPVEPVDPAWAAPVSEPEAPSARPAWTPAVWEPAAPPAPAPSAPPPALEEAPVVEAPVAEPPTVEAPVEVVPEAPAKSSSFLKKEISFGRKPKAEKAERAEKPEKAEKPAGGSFLKKEISFGRKPKAEKAERAEKPEKAEKPAGGSFLKKEISFGRKPKAEKAERAEKPEKAEKPAGGSFLKKDISFGRKPKADKVEKPAKAEKAEKPAGGSFLKKDLTFGRKPKADKGAKPAKAKKAEKASGGSFLKKDLSFGSKLLPGQNKQGSTRGSVMHKKLVGLKVGASQLAAARVSNNGSAQLLQLARQPLDSGIIVGGELRDPDALAEALKSFFAKNKLPRRGVRLGLANNRIGVRVFELEDVGDARQLENAVRFRAQEALPIPIDEAVLDYQVLGERIDEEGRTVRRILLVVAYRELIDRYVAACRKAGLQLVGIDLEAFALLRALSDEQPEQTEPAAAALVAVSIGHDRSTFAVSDGRICEFTRVLDWGGGTLDVAVARALDLAPSEAEPIKRAVGLEGDDVPEGLNEAQTAAAREAIRREIQTFARELVSSLQFYQNQPGSLSIAEIVVTGGTAHLEGLADQLQKLIGVRVRVGDPLAHVRAGKRVKDADQIGSLTVAIGLGVER